MNKPATEPAAVQAEPSNQPLVTDPKLRLIVFLILMTGVFMAMLDNMIVATALPTIVGEFGQIERFGWVGSAYLLTSSAVMPIYGKLGDLFGRKYVMMAAVFIFIVGSLVCALSISMDTLIAARVLQAIGGGGISVTVFSINADLFEPRERAKYQSYTSLVLMMSGTIGPVLGGTMSDLFGWRSIFLINLPIGIAVLAGLAVLLPYKRPNRKPKIDYLGAALLACTIASVVVWADGSDLFGGLLTSSNFVVLAVGVVSAVIWVFVERRAPEPVIPLTFFAKPTIVLLLVVSAMSGAVGIGLSTYFALFLQSGKGLSPSLAGLLFIPLTGGIAIGAVTSGRIIAHTGRYKIFSVLSTGTSMVSLLIFSAFNPVMPIWVVTLMLLIQGVGGGVGQQIPVFGVQNAAERRNVGAATSTVTLTRMGGASIGISIYGAILSAGISKQTVPIPGVSSVEKLSPADIAALPSHTQDLITTLYQHACQPLFFAGACAALIGLIAALSLKNVRVPVKHET